ncbi:hypothetical protein RIK65_09660 [Enterobacter asburiae]|nr:hypothetical protein [Enterobacter asburiae]WNI62365.1 hypothetical protein RIL73_18020 [Enterobacter asburiae]WNI69403.1 hypothetical protein RIK65_09660 [Enterobacter asburiae]
MADSAWLQQWLQRDLADSTATLHREITERAEERRRQKVADDEKKREGSELAKVWADADASEPQLDTLQRQLAGYGTGRLSAIAAASTATPANEPTTK